MADEVTATLQERGKNYGNFMEESKISQALQAVMARELSEDCVSMHVREGWARLAPDQKSALEFIQKKIGRILNGNPDYIDNYLDIAGYAMLIVNRLRSENIDGKK